jgi:hypothetical protein
MVEKKEENNNFVKEPFKERLYEAVFGDKTWEQFQSIGWTTVVLLLIFTFNSLKLYSFIFLIAYAIAYREISTERKVRKNKYNKYSFIKMRIWEDSGYNYESIVSYEKCNLYPLYTKSNTTRIKVFLKVKKSREILLTKVKTLLKNKLDVVNEIKKLEDELNSIMEEEKKEKDKKISMESNDEYSIPEEEKDDEDDEDDEDDNEDKIKLIPEKISNNINDINNEKREKILSSIK